jgi:site-specific recombinase XerD
MGEQEITAFLTHLAVDEHVAPSTQNQALAAILFLYKEVLERELDWMDDIVRAKRSVRIPEVLSPEQVRRLINQMEGPHQLMARLLYGTGMRLMEAVRLRVRDVDFHYRQITVRNGYLAAITKFSLDSKNAAVLSISPVGSCGIAGFNLAFLILAPLSHYDFRIAS